MKRNEIKCVKRAKKNGRWVAITKETKLIKGGAKMSLRSSDLCNICKNIKRGDAGTVGSQIDSINSELMAMMVIRGNISALKDHGRSYSTCGCISKLERAL